MIQGVQVKTLKVLADERGWLMEMLRNDDDLFQGFGQVYLTAAYPGVVKGWHYHKLQVDHFVCVKGMMKVVLFDPREDSPTKGEVNEFAVVIPVPTFITRDQIHVANPALIEHLTTKFYEPRGVRDALAGALLVAEPSDGARVTVL